MRQSHSQSIGEDRRDSDRLMSRSESRSRFRSSSRISTNRDRIRCSKCREYDYFDSECPSSVTDEDLDHDDSRHLTLQMLTHDSPGGSGSCESIDC